MNKKGNIYNVCTTITDSNEAKKAAALIGAAMEFISHYTGIPTNSVKTLQIKFGNNCQSKEEARFSL